MNFYEYKEYDENDMISLYEYTGISISFAKINFSNDYEYGVFIWGNNEFDYDRIYKISNTKNDDDIFEYDSLPRSAFSSDEPLPDIIWR